MLSNLHLAGGTVELSVSRLAGCEELDLRIADTGKGIPPEDLPNIFSPFYQSKYTADDGQPGTGLGLSLVHELVKVYGGKVIVGKQRKCWHCIFSNPADNRKSFSQLHRLQRERMTKMQHGYSSLKLSNQIHTLRRRVTWKQIRRKKTLSSL